MPVTFRFKLRPLREGKILGLGGEALHGLVFKALLQGEPSYARRVHEAPQKPFALSPLEGAEREEGWTLLSPEKEVYFDLSFLTDHAVGIFSQGFIGGNFELGSCPIEILSSSLLTSKDFRILKEEAPQEEKLSLEFISPTVLAKGGRELPLPEPHALLSSLIIRWNTFAPKEFHLDAGKERELKISRFKLHSSLVKFEKFSSVGFMGRVEFKLPRSEEERKEVGFLFHFAEFSGVGHRTAMGLGRVRLAP